MLRGLKWGVVRLCSSKIAGDMARNIKSVISIQHAYSSIIVNWSSHKSNLANPMTYKFWGNVGQNTLKKLPKFDGHGSSLLHATPIVPIHFTHPVELKMLDLCRKYLMEKFLEIQIQVILFRIILCAKPITLSLFVQPELHRHKFPVLWCSINHWKVVEESVVIVYGSLCAQLQFLQFFIQKFITT